MTGIQVYFLVYILRHHVKGTYLTELYHEIGVSKATLSAMIKKLIKEGYLYFQENPEDIQEKRKCFRRKSLWQNKEEFLKRARQTEDKICSALNCQEKMKLRELEQKILEQCERTEHKEKKEDGRFYKHEKSFTAAGKV